jgi:hypothetical protein
LAKDKREACQQKIVFQLKGPAQFFLKKKCTSISLQALQKHFFSGPNKVLVHSCFPLATAENENMTAPYEST